jgi:hypothetical protein
MRSWNHGMLRTVARRGGRAAALSLVAAMVVVACGIHAALPPDTAPPDVVLNAYLTALRESDCETAHALATSTFVKGNGELCGDLHVAAFTVDGPPATPPDGEVIFATTLTTSGSGDGSVPAGEVTWFYSLVQQPGGAWRLTGGGSGP